MARYGVYCNGELLEDEVFDTREEAMDQAEEDSSCSCEGWATLDQFRYSSSSYRGGYDYEVGEV